MFSVMCLWHVSQIAGPSAVATSNVCVSVYVVFIVLCPLFVCVSVLNVLIGMMAEYLSGCKEKCGIPQGLWKGFWLQSVDSGGIIKLPRFHRFHGIEGWMRGEEGIYIYFLLLIK